MSAVPAPSSGLTQDDYRSLAKRWLRAEDAAAAGLFRVDGPSGGELLNPNMGGKGNVPGIAIPYFDPASGAKVHVRIRVDDAVREARATINIMGKREPWPKYLGGAGERNHAYFPVGTAEQDLANPELPIIITEGEFKTLALARLAHHETATRRFLPIGLSGVWNWRGKTGIRTTANGTREPEKGVIPCLRRIEWKGRRVTIAFDADLARKSDVMAARYTLSRELRSDGAIVGYLTWEEQDGKGIDDWLAGAGADPVLAKIAAVDFNRTTGWKALLKRTDTEKVKALLINADIALRHAPQWEGAFEWDAMRQRARLVAESPIGGAVPRDWADDDDVRLAIWMQSEGIDVGRDTVGPVVQALAKECSVHPVRQFLESLQWDGEPRVDGWLQRYLGVVASPYVASVGRWWLISAVARAFKPGCQADHVLLLEGEQGIGKSTVIQALVGPEWFSDDLPDLANKDANLAALNSWVIELAELESLRKAEVTQLKGFITRREENFRPPYGKSMVQVARSCVFVGTTNRTDYLRDETGNRRFWPVRCGSIDREAIAADREQIWAEAVALFRDGAKWWPDKTDGEVLKQIEQEQSDRVDTDPWQGPIDQFLVGRDRVTIEEVLAHLAKVIDPRTMEERGEAVVRRTQADANRAGRCLRLAGFERGRWPVEGNPGERVSGFKRKK